MSSDEYISDTDLPELKSIWDCPYVVKCSSAYWICKWCNTTFYGTPNATRAVDHLKKEGPRLSQIKRCTAKIAPNFQKQYLEYWNRIQAKKDKSRKSKKAVMRQVQRHNENLAPNRKDSPKASSSDEEIGTTIETNYGASARSAASCTGSKKKIQGVLRPVKNGYEVTVPHITAKLDFAIADLIHAHGLPFSLVEHPRFLQVLQLARNAPVDYLPPSRKRISGELLDKIFDQVQSDGKDLLLKDGKLYGMALIGDGATIKKMPLFNVLVSSPSNPVYVADIISATSNYEKGIRKDASSIAKDCFPIMTSLDPNCKFFDLIMFDGASNVQAAGNVIAEKYPGATVIQGSEHVLSLFCKDVLTLPSINSVIKKYKFIYSIFGNGRCHQPYAWFKQRTKFDNAGRGIGLIKAAETRFGGYWYCLHRFLKLEKSLRGVIDSQDFKGYRFSSKNSAKKEKLKEIFSDDTFYNECKVIVGALYFVIRLLRFADSNKPGMDMLKYYMHLTTKYLSEHTGMFDNPKLFINSQSQSLFNLEGLDEDDEISSIDAEDSFDDDDDDDEEDTDEDDSDDDDPATPLSQQILSLWEKRCKKLDHDYSVVGWLLSVHPEVYKNASTYNLSHVEALKRVGRKLLSAQNIDSDKIEEHIVTMLQQFNFFRFQTGPLYGQPAIWNSNSCINSPSHQWHFHHTFQYYKELGLVACRVTSKMLGIGSAERCWGDTKQMKADKRSHLSARTTKKQSIIFGAACLEAARIKKQYQDDEVIGFEVDKDMEDDFVMNLAEVKFSENDNKRKRDNKSNHWYEDIMNDDIVGPKKVRCFFEEFETAKQDFNCPKLKQRYLKKYGGLRYFDPDEQPYRAYTISDHFMGSYRDPEKRNKRYWYVCGVPKGMEDTEDNLDFFDKMLINDDLLHQIQICEQRFQVEFYNAEGRKLDPDAIRRDWEYDSIPNWCEFDNYDQLPLREEDDVVGV